MNVYLHQRRIAYGLKAVDLAGLDHEDVSRPIIESLTVNGPDPAAFADELDFIVRMEVRAWTRSGLAIEEEYRNPCVTLFCSSKLMRTAHKRQILLSHKMHFS